MWRPGSSASVRAGKGWGSLFLCLALCLSHCEIQIRAPWGRPTVSATGACNPPCNAGEKCEGSTCTSTVITDGATKANPDGARKGT